MRRALRRFGLWLAKFGGWKMPRDVIVEQCLFVNCDRSLLFTVDDERRALVMSDYAILPRDLYTLIVTRAGMVTDVTTADDWKVVL